MLDVGAARAGEMLAAIQLLLPDDRASYHAVLAIQQSDDLKLWDTLARSRVDGLRALEAGGSDERLVRRTSQNVHMVHEDSEHEATQQSARAAGF